MLQLACEILRWWFASWAWPPLAECCCLALADAGVNTWDAELLRQAGESPGTKARMAAPMLRGTRMDCTSVTNREAGWMALATLPAPSTAQSMKGMVRMPSRLLPVVSSRAKAVLPPIAWPCACTTLIGEGAGAVTAGKP